MSHDCSFLTDVLPDDQIAFEGSAVDDHAGDVGTPADARTAPDAVVWPESTKDVSAVLAAASERGVPVTPYAAATALEGHAAPVHGGISLDMNRMDAVLEVRPEDFQVDVEPGVLGSAVNEAVEGDGLFFPPLPSSGDLSTIGGMIATDASGMQTVKYGEVGDWVLELEAVLADGSTIEVGSRAVKTSAGYNLKDLLVGSEGTLAVVTRATLELQGIPEQIRGGRTVFADLDGAAAAVSDAVRSGVDVAKIELVDATSARMANAYFDTDLPDAPMVFVEFHANHGVEEEIAFCRTIFETHGVERFEMAAGDEMDELWAMRRELGGAVGAYDDDLQGIHPGDVTVPISEYPDLIRYVKELETDHDVLVPCFGHAGDGNLHYIILVEAGDEDQLELGEELYGRIVEHAVDVGGTATGEHGIGLGKRRYLEREFDPATIETMRRVKAAFDPDDILNPGKVFPETAEGDGRVRLDSTDG